MIIEICANSYQSAINAQQAGADRIELCSELAVGGITPSYGLIQKVKQDGQIPVHILIRPRSGDFTYSQTEFEIIKEDIKLCKDLGCEGVVSGVLKRDGTIDITRTKVLVELAKPMHFTFHRAFDWVVNPLEGLDQLMDIGVDTILTSGQEKKAIQGIQLLKELKERGGDAIKIMPGAGVTIDNILDFKNEGFSQIHFSGTKMHTTQKVIKVAMNSPSFLDETSIAISDVAKMTKMINLIADGNLTKM